MHLVERIGNSRFGKHRKRLHRHRDHAVISRAPRQYPTARVPPAPSVRCRRSHRKPRGYREAPAQTHTSRPHRRALTQSRSTQPKVFKRLGIDAVLARNRVMIDPLAGAFPVRRHDQDTELRQSRRQTGMKPGIQAEILTAAEKLGAMQPREERAVHFLARARDDFIPNLLLLRRQPFVRQFFQP